MKLPTIQKDLITTVQLLSKFEMDIPQDVCQTLGLFAGQKLELSTLDRKIFLMPVANSTHPKSSEQREHQPK